MPVADSSLLPTKTARSDSVGLTISTAGPTLALSVLANVAHGRRLLPATCLVLLATVLTCLMVSRIRYPALASLLRLRGLSGAILGTAALLVVRLPAALVGLALTGGYLSFGLLRAVYEMI